MEVWVLVIAIILTLAIVAMIVLITINQRNNTLEKQRNIIYPFSATIQPGNTSVILQNSTGGSQIDCSAVGGTINIIGAWSEVIDNYNSCTGNAMPSLNLTCGIPSSSKVGCKTDTDCGPGMGCSGGICKPSSCPLTSSTGAFDSSQCSCGGTYCPIQPGVPCKPGTDKCNDLNGTLMTCVAASNSSLGGVCAVNPDQTCFAPDQYKGQFCAIYPLCSNVNITDNTNVVNSICDPNSTNTCRHRYASA